MSKKFTRLMAIVMTIIMCMGMICTSVSAASANDNFPINKVADGLDENDQTNVTLTVPGTLEGYIDVVFVLGGGMTANKETVNAAINVFKDAIKSGKATVRLGIISVEKGQEVILDLNSDEAILTASNYESLISEKFAYINTLPAGSTNLHSQLLTAKRMLKAETKAAPENKYVFVIATGRTYWFDNKNGDESTIVTKTSNMAAGTSGEGAGVYYTFGNYVWQANRGRNTTYYMIPSGYNNDWSKYWDDVCDWVEADGDTYAYTPILNEEDGSAAFANWMNRNAAEWRALYNGNKGSRYGYTIIDPVPSAENFITGAIDAIPYGANPNHALGYERAQYEAYRAYRSLQSAGYNCYALCSEQYRYQNYSSYIAGQASQIQVGHGFMDMLAGGPGKAVVLFEDNGTTSGALKENFFAPIAEDILYSCSKGSKVVDYIGKNENGNFEFIEDAACIKLEVGGVAYTTTKLDVAKEGATSSYTFTAPGASEPTFWLDYYYGDGETTERFDWSFGENVSLSKPAALTYKLQLIDKQDVVGAYNVPTNNSATLYPVDSDGKAGEPQDFPVPTFDYIVREPVHTLGSIVVSKIAAGAETPATTTFQLQKMEGDAWVNVGEAVAYSEFVENTYTFAELEEGTYRVVESGAEVADFNLTTVYSEDVVLTKTTEKNGDTAVNNGAIFVTNTYTEKYQPIHTAGSIVVTKTANGAETPAATTFQLQKQEGEEWVNVGEAVEYAKFVNNAYNFTGLEEGTYRVVESGAEIEGYTLATTYGEAVALTLTTADNGDTSVGNATFSIVNDYEQIVEEEEDDDIVEIPDEDEEEEDDELIEIPDEDIPMADVPKTGDMILPFFGMAVASGVAAIFVGKTGKKEDEE